MKGDQSRSIANLRELGSRLVDRGAYWLECVWSVLKVGRGPARRSHAVTVYFHGIVSGSGDRFLDPQEGITPEFLREFIRSMKAAGYVFVTPAVALGQNRPFGNLAMLSSDDGYCSVESLLPVLRAEAVPLTVFLGTEYCRTDGIWWWDQIHITGRSDFRTRSLLKHSVCSRAARDEALRRLGVDPYAIAFSDSHRLLSPEDVRRLSESPFLCFGNHTRNHLSLPLLEDRAVEEEVEGARRDIEAWTGRTVHHFAFPYGDHDGRTLDLLRRCGYLTAFTTDPGHFVLPSEVQVPGTHIVPRYRLRADRSAKWQARIMRKGITVGARLQLAVARLIKRRLG